MKRVARYVLYLKLVLEALDANDEMSLSQEMLLKEYQRAHG